MVVFQFASQSSTVLETEKYIPQFYKRVFHSSPQSKLQSTTHCKSDQNINLDWIIASPWQTESGFMNKLSLVTPNHFGIVENHLPTMSFATLWPSSTLLEAQTRPAQYQVTPGNNLLSNTLRKLLLIMCGLIFTEFVWLWTWRRRRSMQGKGLWNPGKVSSYLHAPYLML